jgi:signal transduction histidine kinase/CheY-like chemotaxis protein
VTAFLSDDMDRIKAYQQGAVDYLFTPVVPQMLLAKVSAFVTLTRKNLELEIQTAQLKASNRRLQVEIEGRKIADQKSRAKDQFLAMLGHELRNPLSAISNASAVMEMAAASADAQNRARQIIKRQSAHLSSIIDDLLDLSRVIEDKIVLDRLPVNFAGVIERSVETMVAAGRTAGRKLTVDIPAAWISADATRLEQIVTNLLDNAIKYTPDGGEVSVTLGSQKGMAVLTVQDSGIGIAPELLPHVFEVFVQGQDTLNRARGGLGIGLALVNQLVALHSGTIEAHSAGVGQGSTFVLRLPAIEADALLPGAAIGSTAGNTPSQNVLLIEDNDDCRDTLADLLRSHGHHVTIAEDGISGIALASGASTDVAIVDIGLPGMSGYEVAARLRASAGTAQMRLIALTGYGQLVDQRQALDAGFDFHLLKPVNVAALLHSLQVPLPASD